MAIKDAQGRLRVAAASTVGDKGFERSMALIDAGVDLLVIDTAHGHSVRVAEAVERVKRESNSTRIVAGNVATAEATKALIDAGADFDQGRHRAGLDLHHAHRRRRRRAAARGGDGLRRGSRQAGRAGDRRRRNQVLRRSG